MTRLEILNLVTHKADPIYIILRTMESAGRGHEEWTINGVTKSVCEWLR